MAKIYQVPFDKGYARGSADDLGADIPEGFWTGKNMMYREDGALTGRYSYIKHTSGAVGAGTNIVRSLFNYPTGDTLAIASNGLPYRNVSGQDGWTQCTWDQAGTAPNLGASYPGKWGWLNAKPVYSNGYNFPVIFTDSGVNYRDILSSGYKAYIPIEHQNRLLLAALVSNRAMIRYSTVGDPDTGYDSNFVNVGDVMEDIKGIHYMSGNLIVLKRFSIWAKIGMYSQLTSNQFQPVYQGVNPAGGSIVGRNVFYFADTRGLLAYTSGNLVNLTELFDKEWKTRQNTPDGFDDVMLHYWYDKDWLMVTSGSACETTWVYETGKNRWLRFSGLNIASAAQHNQQAGGLIFSRYNSSGEPYVYMFGKSMGEEGAEESFDQEFRTPWLDLKSPYTEKYIRRIYLYADNVDGMSVYLQQNPGDFPETADYTITGPADGESVSLSPSKPFRAVSIKLTGSGNMVVKSVSIEYEERRI